MTWRVAVPEHVMTWEDCTRWLEKLGSFLYQLNHHNRCIMLVHTVWIVWYVMQQELDMKCSGTKQCNMTSWSITHKDKNTQSVYST